MLPPSVVALNPWEPRSPKASWARNGGRELPIRFQIKVIERSTRTSGSRRLGGQSLEPQAPSGADQEWKVRMKLNQMGIEVKGRGAVPGVVAQV
jgi:hypothetical protein